MSGLALARGHAPNQRFLDADPGQSCPQHCPGSGSDPLGAPISIQEVARLLGCSAWTVRNKYLFQGLPYLRSGSQGKLIFYRNQIVRWILERQQKGVAR